jgi:hypothetical protein
MRIYWTLKSIPELTLLSGPERRKVWRSAYRKTLSHSQIWVGLFLLSLFVSISAYLGELCGSGVLGAAIGGGIGGFIQGQVSARLAIPYIREILAQNP